MEQLINAEKSIKAQFYLSPEDAVVVSEIWDQNVYHFSPSRDQWILDIGAHKGIFAVYAALFGANVVAYEPNPTSFDLLLRNVNLNNVSRYVTGKNAAVFSTSGEMGFHPETEKSGGSALAGMKDFPPSAPTIQVRAESFNEVVCRGYNWDIVKVDTEGAEFEMLTNASDAALLSIRRLTVEVHNWRPVELYDAMLERLTPFFDIDGVREASGRWNYIYATAKMRQTL